MPDDPKQFTAKTHAEVAAFFGVSGDTVKTWASRSMPCKGGPYDLGAIVRWLRSEGPWRMNAKPADDDLLLAAEGDSPALERYRAAKAALAELELATKKRELLSVEKARAVHSRWSNILRQAGERLNRFGPDAVLLLNDALGECEGAIDDELGTSEFADDHASE